MFLSLTYDRAVDAWTLAHEGAQIATSQDVAEWKRLLLDELKKKLGGRRAYLLIDMKGFSISPVMMHEYGAVAKEITAAYALGIIRYGVPQDQWTTTEVMLQAVINRFPANIFPDRPTALRALQRIRALPVAPSP